MNTQEHITARVIKEISTNTHGVYVLQPLERGFGITIGNVLRRVLLASIPGAAISSIRIDGVLHEFTSIPGVKEDVVEIILNLKQVRFKLYDLEPDKIHLQCKGEGVITAADIGKDTTQFKILNPDQHICTLNEKADFSMELKISRGTGWVPAERNKTADFPIGTIFIDSIFSPITNVSYKVDNLPGTSHEVLEKMRLDIQTDGSITPEESLDIASNLLKEYLSLFSKVEPKSLDYSKDFLNVDILRIRNLLKKSVDEMELSVRAYNCLKANNLRTIADLVSKEESEMLKFKNFGRKSLNELMLKLKSMGLEFGMDVKKYLTEK